MANEVVESLVARSRAAQKQIENYTQEQVDAICKMLAKVVFDNAEMFARLAVEETRMGVYDHKVAKCLGKSRAIWCSLKNKKSVGIIEVDEEAGLAYVAKPMGVVGAAMPCTNPVVTPMCNGMFAIKGRNSIIVAPHPRAKKVTKLLVDMYHEELRKMGVPEDIFLAIENPSIEDTTDLMAAVDVVLATGGKGVVVSAYSSGKPSYGVGAGNVQGLIDEDVDFAEAATKIIASRTFDNGIICSGDQTLIAPASKFNEIIAEFEKQGTFFTDDPEVVDKFRKAVFPGGAMNKDLVGQTVDKVAAAAGVEIPEGTKMIMVKTDKFGADDVLSKEKMCPMMSAYEYKTWEEGVAIAKANLLLEGAGHSCSIQSNNQAHVEYAGVELPVSRILVNQSCATMNGGAFANSLSPTTTLGCGSWGNNSISENLTYYHLFNKSRIAYTKKNWSQPTDEEIWG